MSERGGAGTAAGGLDWFVVRVRGGSALRKVRRRVGPCGGETIVRVWERCELVARDVIRAAGYAAEVPVARRKVRAGRRADRRDVEVPVVPGLVFLGASLAVDWERLRRLPVVLGPLDWDGVPVRVRGPEVREFLLRLAEGEGDACAAFSVPWRPDVGERVGITLGGQELVAVVIGYRGARVQLCLDAGRDGGGAALRAPAGLSGGLLGREAFSAPVGLLRAV